MYQRAKSLQDLISDPSTFIYLAEEQLEAYMVAINALSLLERRIAWIAMPMVYNTDGQVKAPLCFLLSLSLMTIGSKATQAITSYT
jgi:hypothetical protein